jgi:CRISPR-associated protein Cmr5
MDMTETMTKSLEQDEALYALKSIQSLQDGSREIQRDYLTQVKRLPAMVLSNGLGHSLAFLLAKDKESESSVYYSLFKHIADWLTEQKVYPAEGDIMKHMMEGTMTQYIEAQSYVMRILTWLVRFAKAYLSSEEAT